MPRTRAQIRATQGISSLGEDNLHNILAFVPIDECRARGCVSKAFQAVAASTSLARARFSDKYVLRGAYKHGVVHALTTACGTREWPTRLVQWTQNVTPMEVAAPPPALRISTLIDSHISGHVDLADADFLSYFMAGVANPKDPLLSPVHAVGYECNLVPGCFVEYELPFRMTCSSFHLGFGNCYGHHFREWVFEAFEGERENVWHVLYDSVGVSPWPHEPPLGVAAPCPHTTFAVDAHFPSSRFRIRLVGNQEQCFHLRGFEIFGTVLPPWRLD